MGKSIMDGVYVLFILVEHHLFFSFYLYMLLELYLMVQTFIIQIHGFQEFFFSLCNRVGMWRTLCLQSNIEEVLSISFLTPICSLGFCMSSSFLSSFSFI